MEDPVYISSKQISESVSVREGEKKLGQVADFASGKFSQWLKKTTSGFIVLGIPESIGVRANFGNPGTEKMWDSFLPKFLNVQYNTFFEKKKIGIAGAVKVSDLEKLSQKKFRHKKDEVQHLRELTAELDVRVSSVIEKIIASGKRAIIIGGGHNNAFGNIAGTSKALGKKISAINIDAHADLRKTEGRHSGNGFSYALKNGYLEKYFVIGLHENYNSDFILSQFAKNKKPGYITFDSYLRGETTLEKMTDTAIRFTGMVNCGIELDLDAIAGFPSSAETETGFSANEARKIILTLAARTNHHYLHLTEGAPFQNPASAGRYSKLAAYLATDYIKATPVR